MYIYIYIYYVHNIRYYPRIDIFGPIASGLPGLHRLLPAPRCGLRSQGGRTQRHHRGWGLISTTDGRAWKPWDFPWEFHGI